MLNKEQKHAFDSIMKAAPGTIATIRGSAGTGKTHTAAAIIDGHLTGQGDPMRLIDMEQEFGKKPFVKIITPTAAAKSVIQRKTFKNAKENLDSGTLKKSQFSFSTLASFAKDVADVVHLNEMRFFVSNQEEIAEFQKHAEKMGLTKVDVGADIFYERDVYVDGQMERQTFISEQALKDAAWARFKWKDKQVSIETEFPLKDPGTIAKSLKDVTLLIIDEATMVTQEESEVINKAIELMLDELKTCGEAPIVIYVGDKKQIPPVNGRINDYMNSVNTGPFIFELIKDVRATDELTRVSKMIGGGQTFKALTFLPQMIESKHHTVNDLIDEYNGLFEQSDIVIAHEVDIVNQLNKKLRAVKGFTNSESIEEGETLAVKKNVKHHEGLSNGDTVKINKVYDLKAFREFSKAHFECVDPHDTIIMNQFEDTLRMFNSIVNMGELVFAEISIMDGLIKKHVFIENPLTYTSKARMNDIEKNIEASLKIMKNTTPVVRAMLGYARTIHTAQGSEWDNVVCIIRDKGYRFPNESNLEYVGSTRATTTFTGIVTKNIKTKKELNKQKYKK